MSYQDNKQRIVNIGKVLQKQDWAMQASTAVCLSGCRSGLNVQ
jgi:hypothetical protein